MSTVYSDRLGAITDEQFAAACERLGVGKFIRAAPTTSGLFGQNVFLTTSEGAFVLRGAPHWVKDPGSTTWRPEDRWQFTKEGYFARRLREETATPAPSPWLHDEAADIFGWPYVIMPRMPGVCFDDSTVREQSIEDQHAIARALGAMLAEMQKLTSPFAGDFDMNTIQLTPYPNGFRAFAINYIREGAKQAETNGAMTAEDHTWVEEVIAATAGLPARPNTYVHRDYKLNNLTVSRQADGSWRGSGLFDFHEASFGDGAIDLVRQSCSYLDADRDLVRSFIAAYRADAQLAPPAPELMRLYILYDRIIFWSFFTNPQSRAPWTQGRTLRQFAERYTTRLLELL